MYSLSSKNDDSWLSWFLRGLLLVLFLILFGKVIEIQVIKGDYYRSLSDQNRIRHIPIPAPRGKILAKGEEALTDNVAIKKRYITDGQKYVLSEDLTNAAPSEIVTDYKRVYPLGSVFAHASGYMSMIGDKEVGTVDPKCPEKGVRLSGTLVGVTGLEAEYECDLRGIPGEELIEVDTRGKKIRTLAIKNPVPGKDIKTSIDLGLQKQVALEMESMMANKKVTGSTGGAAIVTDNSGQVLAFYSMPSFDPNLFINKDDPAKIKSVLNDARFPLFNRETGGTFHPGSVFKPIVALAALEERAIDKSYLYTDTGSVTVNGFTYTNWYFTEYGRAEGQINLIRAMARSTDTFFYKMGELAGPANIAKWAGIFGLNQLTGIDLPGEVRGLIPTPAWKQKTMKEGWFLGNTYHMSIGQGDVSVTPIEINTYIQALAQNGKYCPPHFIDVSRNSHLSLSNFQCKQINVTQKNIDLIKEGMKEACKDGGTAYSFFDFSAKHNGQTIACKTGTAEVGTDGIPHAWFTLFTPAEKPKITVTILFERGGQGSQVAGPVARKIVDYYYQGISN
jgi:penicillin-binding protein 2